MNCAMKAESVCGLCICCPGCGCELTPRFLSTVALAVTCGIILLVIIERTFSSRCRSQLDGVVENVRLPSILAHPEMPQALSYWFDQGMIDETQKAALLASLPSPSLMPPLAEPRAAYSVSTKVAQFLFVLALLVAVLETGQGITMASLLISVFTLTFGGTTLFAKAVGLFLVALLLTPLCANGVPEGAAQAMPSRSRHWSWQVVQSLLFVLSISLLVSCGIDASGGEKGTVAGLELWWQTASLVTALSFTALCVARLVFAVDGTPSPTGAGSGSEARSHKCDVPSCSLSVSIAEALALQGFLCAATVPNGRARGTGVFLAACGGVMLTASVGLAALSAPCPASASRQEERVRPVSGLKTATLAALLARMGVFVSLVALGVESWHLPFVFGLNVALRLAAVSASLLALLSSTLLLKKPPRVSQVVVCAAAGAAQALTVALLALLWAVAVIGNSGSPEDWALLVDLSFGGRESSSPVYSGRAYLLLWSLPYLVYAASIQRARSNPVPSTLSTPTSTAAHGMLLKVLAVTELFLFPVDVLDGLNVPVVGIGVFTLASVHLLRLLSWSSYLFVLAFLCMADFWKKAVPKQEGQRH